MQGVFFRQSTCQRAMELGLSGWVRNRRDGSVELVAEGKRTAVDALVGWCKQGPEMANVTDLERRDEEPVGLDGSFDVRATL